MAVTRFDALAALFDASTFRHFDRVGIDVGWRCREVGAGGPSVAGWLSERVGPGGRVLATDIDVSWAGFRSPRDSPGETGRKPW